MEQTRQTIDQRQAELDGTGRFSGGKRAALGEEIARLKAAQEARMSSLAAAEEQAEALRLRAEQRLAVAREQDEKARVSAQARADKAAAVAEASSQTLAEALDEQAYRERNGVQVPDDPAVLAREQAEREQARQAQREQMERTARDTDMAQVQAQELRHLAAAVGGRW